MNEFFCAGCGGRLPDGGGTTLFPYPIHCEEYGYKFYCYDCAPAKFRQLMIERGRARLYLTFNEHADVANGYGHLEVMNSRGTLRFPVEDWKESRRRDFTYRTDVWFTFDGSIWHGASYGDCVGAQPCRVKRTKRKSLPDKSFRLGGKS